MNILDNIGIKYGTDKNSKCHDYLKIYEGYLSPYRSRNISLIECGVGGYQYPDRGGESLRMWYEYFPHGKIIGIDIYDKNNIINNRTEFWKGSQTDKHLLKTIIEREEKAAIRVFIDDASHVNHLTIETFKIVFPLLSAGDIYIVEDVHTSYWEKYFDGNPEPGKGLTTMNYFTFLCHQLNHETLLPEYRNEFATLIEFIHFYKEVIVIKRK